MQWSKTSATLLHGFTEATNGEETEVWGDQACQEQAAMLAECASRAEGRIRRRWRSEWPSEPLRYPVPVLAAIALGSNLPSPCGTPADNLREALKRLAALGTVVAASGFRETEPVGLRDQPRFTNAAVLLETNLGPLPLLRALLAIEAAMGRIRAADGPPKGPRLIDLDLLLYATDQPSAEAGRSLVLAGPELTLPHPALQERRFVLDPLTEIAPHLRHPVLGGTIADLLARLGA